MIWLFDYDLTLYGTDESFVLDSLDRNITRFLEVHLQLEEQHANAMRKAYCQQYGTTLGGLRVEHGVRPEDYFTFIHGGSQLLLPQANPELRKWLLALPGRRAIFTNARADWMQMGAESMGILDCFEMIIDIECLEWQNKPTPAVYDLAEQKLQVALGEKIIFFEDKLENLLPAKARGWKTVWVNPEAHNSVADWQVKNLMDFRAEWVL